MIWGLLSAGSLLLLFVAITVDVVGLILGRTPRRTR